MSALTNIIHVNKLSHKLKEINNSTLRDEAGFTINQICMFSEEFERREFGAPSVVSRKIREYLEMHETLANSNLREQSFNEKMNSVIPPLETLGHIVRKTRSTGNILLYDT